MVISMIKSEYDILTFRRAKSSLQAAFFYFSSWEPEGLMTTFLSKFSPNPKARLHKLGEAGVRHERSEEDLRLRESFQAKREKL